MFFFRWMVNDRDRRLARDEAVAAIERHGEKAESALLLKSRQTPSSERRKIYKLARRYIRTDLVSLKAPRDL